MPKKKKKEKENTGKNENETERSKWSVTLYDSRILCELRNHPLFTEVSKRSEYLEELQNISPC